MRIVRLNPFKEDYKKLPPNIQKRADEKITFLITNPRHPSLGTKKVQGTEDIWEGRTTEKWSRTVLDHLGALKISKIKNKKAKTQT
jgi:hypothetical protein